jgi:flagellar basal body-associated protein FliL
MKGSRVMNGKLDELLSFAKISELIRKNEVSEEKKRQLTMILAICAVILAAAAVAFVIFKLVSGEDEDFDDDFDDDFEDFEDDFVDEAPEIKPES